MTDEENGKTEEKEQPSEPVQQQQVQIGPQQIQAAAAAGSELLSDKDLKVPLGVAGALSMLQNILAAVARGELVIVSAKEAESPKISPPNKRPNRSKQPRGARK